jgi:hypothetical protein
MFTKGNKYGVGRPKISLNKPELLLPIIFQKAHINWANDFTLLYKIMKSRPLTTEEQGRYKMYLELMPYLCTKVNIKELDASKFTTESDKKAMTDQTKSLLDALEGMNVNSKSGATSQKPSVENRPPQIPPTH